MRLRDLGGLLVIDFIDMNASRNRMKVERAMREAMKGDRAKYDLTRLSKLGLMECARQRNKSAKMAASYATCPACEGYGLIKNVETAALAALRKLQTRSSRSHIGRLRVGLPTEVAMWLLNNKREELVRIERLALEDGAGVQSDFLDAAASLAEARAGFAQARRAALLAQIRLARAAGQLTPEWLSDRIELR